MKKIVYLIALIFICNNSYGSSKFQKAWANIKEVADLDVKVLEGHIRTSANKYYKVYRASIETTMAPAIFQTYNITTTLYVEDSKSENRDIQIVFQKGYYTNWTDDDMFIQAPEDQTVVRVRKEIKELDLTEKERLGKFNNLRGIYLTKAVSHKSYFFHNIISTISLDARALRKVLKNGFNEIILKTNIDGTDLTGLSEKSAEGVFVFLKNFVKSSEINKKFLSLLNPDDIKKSFDVEWNKNNPEYRISNESLHYGEDISFPSGEFIKQTKARSAVMGLGAITLVDANFKNKAGERVDITTVGKVFKGPQKLAPYSLERSKTIYKSGTEVINIFKRVESNLHPHSLHDTNFYLKADYADERLISDMEGLIASEYYRTKLDFRYLRVTVVRYYGYISLADFMKMSIDELASINCNNLNRRPGFRPTQAEIFKCIKKSKLGYKRAFKGAGAKKKYFEHMELHNLEKITKASGNQRLVISFYNDKMTDEEKVIYKLEASIATKSRIASKVEKPFYLEGSDNSSRRISDSF